MRTSIAFVLGTLLPVCAFAQGTPPVQPKVAYVEKLRQDNSAELKDLLTLKVEKLQDWRKANATVPLTLFLDGIELKNVALAVTNVPGSTSDSLIKARLEVDDTDANNRRNWVLVLKGARGKEDTGTVLVSVGPSGAPFSTAAAVALRVDPWYRPVVWLFLGLVVVIIIVLGYKSNLLRDVNGATPPPHSLAKYQMAVWFVVVVGSYLYVWMLTGTFSAISVTALTLIGVSGVTGLVAATMDSSKRVDAVKERVTLAAERDALADALNGPAGLAKQLASAAAGSAESLQLVATISVKQTRLNELQRVLAAAVAGPMPSRRWYLDLLSDQSGVSFHRLQMAVWTLVLAFVFVRAVYVDALMPDFDATLLGLLGISSGTYLGFKFPETAK